MHSNQLAFFNVDKETNSYEEICFALSGKPTLGIDEFGAALSKWATTNNSSPNIVALFSGAGGLDIGFCNAGFNLIESVEIEEKFVASMLKNQSNGSYFPNANIVCKDIREYVPKLKTKIDFVIGGPPCQSFSAAGRRAAGVVGTKDDRGNLFEEYVRVLKQLKPKGFLFENVYGLLGAEKGESIKKITRAFEEIGYTLSYRVLDAADYGVPQHRERLILVGAKEKIFKFPKPTHGPDSGYIPHLSASEAIDRIQNNTEKFPSINGRFGHLLQEVPPGLNYSFFTERMGHPNPIFAWRSKFSDFLYKADPAKPIRTLKASGGQYTGPFHWENRHFSVSELKRLQTFPDDYEIVGNRAIASKQIGNSVPPQMSRILAIAILEQFFNVKLPFELKYLSPAEKLTFRRLKMSKTEIYLKAASSAIENTINIKQQDVIGGKFGVSLSKNFKLTIDTGSDVTVSFNPQVKKWDFTLKRNGETKKIKYKISLYRQSNEALFREITQVNLISYSSKPLDYTILWKMLEKTLADNYYKADLVQLFGYYQYSNNIEIDFVPSIELDEPIWKVAATILQDQNIGKIQSIKEFSSRYDISEKTLIKCFHDLRDIGFEIRNGKTNSEIPPNHYLIPYKFPTLTHLSVQLNKSL